MNTGVNVFITTQQELLNEIKKIIEMYKEGSISQSDFESTITSNIEEYSYLVIHRESDGYVVIKGAALHQLGKKRLRLIAKCLERKHIAELIDIETGKFKLKAQLTEV